MKLGTTIFLGFLTAIVATSGFSGSEPDESNGWKPLGTRKCKISPATPVVEKTDRSYARAVSRTAAMVGDARARSLVAKQGLSLLNVTWEDTGRYKGSSVGPNISDMTIQVGVKRPHGKGYDLSLMPV